MEVPVLLRTLISRFDPGLDLSAVPDVEILGVKDDSRLVAKGDLFIARPGTKTDGREFIDDAAAKGRSRRRHAKARSPNAPAAACRE